MMPSCSAKVTFRCRWHAITALYLLDLSTYRSVDCIAARSILLEALLGDTAFALHGFKAIAIEL